MIVIESDGSGSGTKIWAQDDKHTVEISNCVTSVQWEHRAGGLADIKLELSGPRVLFKAKGALSKAIAKPILPPTVVADVLVDWTLAYVSVLMSLHKRLLKQGWR